MSGERRALIAPLGAPGRADEITLRISEAIQLGLLSDGERLPPEAEFAQQFGVSPVTLREAIATLRERGLIETRRGRNGGSFVKRVAEPDETPDIERLGALSATVLRDMADEHMAVASMSARLAAERAGATNVSRIRFLAGQLGSAMTRGERMKADSRFHIEVAIATRSERLTRREVAAQAETVGMLWTSHLDDQQIRAIEKEHLAISSAIVDEDGATAGELAEEHVRNNIRRLTQVNLQLAKTRSR